MFIVLYGINNLGKSTQAKLLVERLNKEGHKAEYIKYPIYDLEPSGVMINIYLRDGNPLKLTSREVQIIYALNRTQYQEALKYKLNEGITVVGEDYTGSGLAWGKAWGVEEPFLKQINTHLLKEDLAFVFDGERFTDATEAGHINETNETRLRAAREAYLHFAEQYDWLKVDANQSIDKIHESIWQIVQKKL